MGVDQKIKLISQLKRYGYIKTTAVEKAFIQIPREHFIPPTQVAYAYDDTPLQIGMGQTISAPHMVAIMCEALDIKPGQKILEIGTGFGYHAAIISKIVRSSGHVYSVERLESLSKQAIKNIKTLGITNVTICKGDGSEGLPKYAPYDRIYVTCAAPSIPPLLINQLKTPGKILVPEGNMICTLMLYEKNKNDVISHNLGGCAFVPLIGKYGHH
jgi:protein-L-isoaspartate(D-aspartate) O-methyltransferase